MENLKEKTAKGLFWGAMSNGTTQVLNLVFGIFLARLLTPAEYGIVGVLAIFSALAGTIQSGGFGAGLINLKHATDNDYNSVFWLNICVSSILYLLLFFCAPVIAVFFKQPCLVLVSRILFLSLPISALALVSGTYLTKNMMNRELAVISVVALVLAGVTGIILALLKFSYWSLVGQQLVYVIASDIGRFYYAPWHPSLKIDFGPVKRMYSFCVKLMVTNIINIVNQNVLTFVFGRLFSISSVGNYSQSNKWNSMAHSTISSTVNQIAQTVLVSVSDERERENRVLRKLLRFTAFLSFPAMLGLAMVSHEFILLTIGEKWRESVPLLQLLCLSGAFMPIYTLYQNLAISHGRSDINMWLNIVQIALQLCIILIFYREGIKVMVTAYTIFNIVWLAAWQLATRRIVGLRFLELLKDVVPFMLIAATVMTAAYYATLFIENLWILLIVRVVIAAALYFVVMRLLNVAILRECMQFVLKKKQE